MKYLDFMASDRAYFKRHPRSVYRIRRVMPGKTPGSPGYSGERVYSPGADPNAFDKLWEATEAELAQFAPTHVVVRRIGPCVRARKFFTLPDIPIPGHKWSEEDARLLWEEGWLPLPVPDFPPPPLGERSEMPRAPVAPLREGNR